MTPLRNKIKNTDMLTEEINAEMIRGFGKFGSFHSPHEIYGVLLEEVEEFWASVKENKPDVDELIQICAVAKRAILEIRADKEVEEGWKCEKCLQGH